MAYSDQSPYANQSAALATVTTLGTITNPLPAGTNLLGAVKTKAGMSVLGTSVATPAASSKVLPGAGGLSTAIPAGTLRMLVWASAAGITMNYNAAATASTVPVPTAPLELECNAADAALLQFIGDAAKTLNIVFLG